MAQSSKKPFDLVPRVHTLESTKFHLTAKKLDNGDFPPKLQFSMWGGHPRINFNAGFKYGNGGDGTTFIARMDIPTATAFLNIIKQFATSDEESIEQVAVTCGTTKQGGKPWEIEHNTRIYVGKDSEGIFINVVTKTSSYNVKFYIVPSIYHKFIDSNNKPLTGTKMAKFYAYQWADDLIKLILLYAHETSYRGTMREPTIVDRQIKEMDKKNNGGNNSGYSNNSKQSSSSDDWQEDSSSNSGWD